MNDQTVSSATEYSIIELVGEGTTGSVYKALKRDKAGHFQETVAIKAFLKCTNIEGWQKEYTSLVKVHSPFCVRVHSFEWIFEGPAITMDFVEGYALSELLSSGDLTEEMATEILSQCLLGLDDLWAADLFHGDLSPKNIMIDQHGQVKLLDFGLGNYQARVKYGTPFFTHPDVMKGEGPSRKMDLFSLGQVVNWTSQRLQPFSESLNNLGKSIVGAPTRENESLRSLESRVGSREVLAELVRKRLREAEQLKTERTQEYIIKSQAINYNELDSKVSNKKSPFSKRFSKLAFALTMTLLVTSLAFLLTKMSPKSEQPPEASVLLQIRTQKWKQIWIDGKVKGYTPADVKDLSPGRHTIKWTSSEGSGELTINLEEGETRVLTDEDFSSL